MKIASWIFTVLSFLGAGVLVLLGVLFATGDDRATAIVLAVVCFLVLGFIGHILINKYRCGSGQGGLAVYILSFPAYIIPFIALFLLLMLIKLIDAIIYAFTQRHYMYEFINYTMGLLLGKPRNKSASGGGTSAGAGKDAYVVIDGGYERTLTFTESKQDHDSGQMYNRFRDDTGAYWRSYDNNNTFVKETYEQTSRGY